MEWKGTLEGSCMLASLTSIILQISHNSTQETIETLIHIASDLRMRPNRVQGNMCKQVYSMGGEGQKKNTHTHRGSDRHVF